MHVVYKIPIYNLFLKICKIKNFKGQGYKFSKNGDKNFFSAHLKQCINVTFQREKISNLKKKILKFWKTCCRQLQGVKFLSNFLKIFDNHFSITFFIFRNALLLNSHKNHIRQLVFSVAITMKRKN